MSSVFHCTQEHLSDLDEALATIRSWPGIREPRPGDFFIKGAPFLRFMRSEDMRWAKARRGVDWGRPIVLPRSLDETERKRLIRELKDRYLRTSYALSRRVVA